MTDRAARAITTLARTIEPPDLLRQRQAVHVAIDDQGKVNPKSAAALRSPIDFHWGPDDTGGRRAPRASRLVLLSAYAGTPPSTGNATVTYTLITPLLTDDVTLTIPNGEQFADSTTNPVTLDIPAGGILFAAVTDAQGAADVSIFTTLELL